AFQITFPETRMKVIITGGGGFLGSQLCQKLLDRGRLTGPTAVAETIREIVLLDAAFHRPATDPRIRQITGDISDRDTVFSAIRSMARPASCPSAAINATR